MEIIKSSEGIKSKRNEYMREYRKKNAEKMNLLKKNWVQRNKDKLKEYNKRYYEGHKEKMIEQIQTKKKQRLITEKKIKITNLEKEIMQLTKKIDTLKNSLE